MDYVCLASVRDMNPTFFLLICPADAGGPLAKSQLAILVELMCRLNDGTNGDDGSYPCSIFDVIGGVGTGG
jgi:hypothetical protein